MRRLLILLAGAASSSGAGATAQPLTSVDDAIDWPAYLGRHDPVWAWGTTRTCSSGYSVLHGTIKHEDAACPAPKPCSDASRCEDESATACDACDACTSFGLSPRWHNGTLAQLYGNVTAYIPNADWTTFAKGGPALANHSSCSTTGTPRALAWEDSAFFGNGLTGGLLRVDAAAPTTSLRVDWGRVDVWDRRAPGSAYSVDSPLFDRPRLPVGFLTLRARGNITAGGFVVHLLNATVAGFVETTAGRVDFTLLAHYDALAAFLSWSASGGEAPGSDGTGGFAIAFTPIRGNATRANPPAGYKGNPEPTCAGGGWGLDDVRVCTQALLAGSNYATALVTLPRAGGAAGAFVSVWHTANDWPAATSPATAAAAVAAQATAAAAPGGFEALAAAHARTWAAIWPASFLSVPDTAVEATYVMQIYKYASAVRPGGVAVDLMGPWWQPSAWEAYWWDMNVPVSYWALYAAGRFDLAATLTDFLLSNVSQLAANVRPQPQFSDGLGMGGASSYDLAGTYTVAPGAMIGNFPWACHNLYMHASFAGDDALMRDRVFPLLRGAVNVYLRFSFEDGAGRIHLPATQSPEYPYPHGPSNDTNYDLMLFAWGCRTLLELAARFAPDDPLVPSWRRVVADLAPFPVDAAHGYNVSLGIGFDVGHRHFSHLFAMYPLHLLPYGDSDGGSPATRSLFTRSLDRWTGLTCTGGGPGERRCPNGFTYVGAASMSALAGGTDGDEARRAAAVGNISGFVRSGLMHASTLYSEGRQPCFESPPGIASSLQEVLLQSWGGRVRVFPAVPAAWPDAVIHDLAGEGGLRVSAVRAGGATAWVALTRAGAAGNATLALGAGLRAPLGTSPPGVPLAVLPNGDVVVTLPRNVTVVVFGAGGGAGPFVVRALPGNASEFHYWGVH